MNRKPLPCQLGMAGVNFKHLRADLCYRSIKGTATEHKTFDDIVQDPILCEQRKQLLNGEFPEGCYDCKFMEEQGFRSYRLTHKLNDHTDDWFLNNVDKNTGKVTKLFRIEFRFSNRCNFACRHCSVDYSTSWQKIARNNPEILSFPDLSTTVPEESFVNKIDISGIGKWIDKLDSNEDMEIEITGGEPFFQPEFYEYLKTLSKWGKKIRLIITTNGSIAGKFKSYNVTDLLMPFKKVDLKVSMDGSKSFYNYFREGGDWDKVIDNVISIDDACENVTLHPVVTVSHHQGARLSEIYEDFLKYFGEPTLFNAGEVLHPESMNLVHMPRPLKDRYLNDWLSYKEKLYDPANWADRVGDFSVKMFKSKDGDPKQWENFCRYTDALDKIHKKNVFDYFPEWEEFWHKSS